MTMWKNGIAKLTIPTPFPVGDVNVYLVRDDRLTLVDVGPKTDVAWEALKGQLNDLGLTPNDIEQVILTHHHPDHAGLLDYFPKELEVYGHPVNERWINRTEDFLDNHYQFFIELFQEFGIPNQFLPTPEFMRKTLRFSCNRSLTGELEDGDIPVGLHNWKVIETPGHAQSHIALFREEDGVLIGGDLLIAKVSPNPLLEPPLPGEDNRAKSQLQLNDSLRKIDQLPIQVVYSGHGADIFDASSLIQKRLTGQHQRAMLVKKWLETESMTVFEICQRLFPKVYVKELSLTISETVAQLDYLADLKEIDIHNDNGLYRYSAI